MVNWSCVQLGITLGNGLKVFVTQLLADPVPVLVP